MAKARLFIVTTPLGYKVVLTRDRWRQIIRFKHPALKGREKEIKKCLEDPAIVRESAKDADVHLYYREEDSGFLCAVSAPSGDGDYFVVTAYFSKNIKEGRQLWEK